MKPDQHIILIVDDELDILELLSFNISKEGYIVHTASNGFEAIEIAKKIKPHLIILDIMMPDMDGIETCEQLRQIPGFERTVIAFFTARGEDYSQIAGFEAGADDYINKLVRPKVLISRIKALLKRYDHPGFKPVDDQPVNSIHSRDLIIDREKFIVFSGNNELFLPRKEFELLALLSSKPGKVFTRDEIYTKIWGDDVVVGDRTIDVHIRKLREKIGEDQIKTIKGVGYKFVE
jgi:two-component system alkaline phosphatase synthesis response regulator PhoP